MQQRIRHNDSGSGNEVAQPEEYFSLFSISMGAISNHRGAVKERLKEFNKACFLRWTFTWEPNLFFLLGRWV